MSKNIPVYSIQRTYIITPRMNANGKIFTCEQRIDIPTIEPLPSVKPVFYNEQPLTVIPCIELAGEFFSEIDLTFETNEGVTILPERIVTGMREPLKNPYPHVRYVLVLPRGATGVKSCKIIHKATGKEVQHNLTFGVMPPPYNYDNILFGYIMTKFVQVGGEILNLQDTISRLKLSTKRSTFKSIKLYRNAGKQTIKIEDGVLFYDMGFIYASSVEPITHKPKITLHGGETDFVYTLSLNKTMSAVSIDLFTGKITVYDVITGEIIQQFMVDIPFEGFETLSFEDFYDLEPSYFEVFPKGARVI